MEERTQMPDTMPDLIVRYQADRDSLNRLFTAPYSPRRRDRLRAFYHEWQETLDTLNFGTFSRNDRADWILLQHLLEGERRGLEQEERLFVEMQPLLSFASLLIALEDDRRLLNDVDAEAVAECLWSVGEQVQATQTLLQAEMASEAAHEERKPTVANRAAETLAALRDMLANWFGFYHSYDPLFTWWVEMPYRKLDKRLEEYTAFLRKEVAGAEDEDAIIGDPLGREALLAELKRALLPYSPEELVVLARHEMDWCVAEMRRAAQELGYADDWHGAVEHVKNRHVAPGAQPGLVRDLAHEAIRYVQEHDLVTVPPLALECWRMEMMSPEKQKINPFFLGGEEIIVSFPTNTMEHAQKRMSLRGNNRHFARATVQHELIPGHYLQMFHQERCRPYRRIFYTPFWTEGWTLHWEMLLWDLGFAQTPEDRIGMLFWRMHRCARVAFSLGFHLGQMSPQECVDLLVQEVRHERDNAMAEVRRSFGGTYDPLYQCAYLLGGLQVRALHHELVGSGRMSHQQFHDAMLQANCMPIPVLRALLTDQPLKRDFEGDWRFYHFPVAQDTT